MRVPRSRPCLRVLPAPEDAGPVREIDLLPVARRGVCSQQFADLRQDAGGPTYFSADYSLPPVGTCTMYSGEAFDAGMGTLSFAPQSKALDGGPALQVAAGGAKASVGRVSGVPQLYGTMLG